MSLLDSFKNFVKYFLFFLFFQTCIYSQYIDINGNVRSNSGALSYANLILLDSDLGTIADENGNFKLKADLSIDKILLVSYVGYVSKKISLKDSSFDFNDLQIILEEDLNGLNEVVITGTLKDEFVKESSVKVNVIT